MSHIVTCPFCSTQVRVPERNMDKTFICPRCLADVDNSWPGSQIQVANLNTDVRRDVNVGSIVLAVLIILCVIGVVAGFLIPTPKEAYGVFVNAVPLMFCFALLDVLVSIAIIRALVRRSVYGTHAPSVGKVLGIVLLSLGTIVAVIIFFFGTCMALLKTKSP